MRAVGMSRNTVFSKKKKSCFHGTLNHGCPPAESTKKKLTAERLEIKAIIPAPQVFRSWILLSGTKLRGNPAECLTAMGKS